MDLDIKFNVKRTGESLSAVKYQQLGRTRVCQRRFFKEKSPKWRTEIDTILTFTKCVWGSQACTRCAMSTLKWEGSRKCWNTISVCPGGSPGAGGTISISLRICWRSLCGLLLTTDYSQHWLLPVVSCSLLARLRTESSANRSIIYDRVIITKWLTGKPFWTRGSNAKTHWSKQNSQQFNSTEVACRKDVLRIQYTLEIEDNKIKPVWQQLKNC